MGVKNALDAPPESDRFAWAPHPRDTFAFFGHRKAEAELLDAYRAGRLPQAWILGGPQGIGKATLAWRMARFLAAHPDPDAPAVQNARGLDVDPDHPAARKISALSFGDLASDERARIAHQIIAADGDVAEESRAGAVLGPIGIGAIFSNVGPEGPHVGGPVGLRLDDDGHAISRFWPWQRPFVRRMSAITGEYGLHIHHGASPCASGRTKPPGSSGSGGR